jgi:LuxR family transcriptional regulator, maltose regulon positive regulatory protein
MPHPRTTVEPRRTPESPALREDPLLDPKFRLPSPPADLVVRRRLLELVERGVQLPLTLVSAPAGYGKTVLVASWAAQADPDSTVLPMLMDDQDESLVGFWASAVEGLRRIGVDVAGVRIAVAPDGIDRWMGMSLARRIAAFGRPVVWVLDTGESMLSPAVAAGLRHLLHDCAGRLRLVLLTRVDPPLPLHRYRLDNAITEIRAEDLAFTATEVAALMQRAGLDLEAVDVASLRARTAGWPAGLRFAMMSLTGRDDIRQAIREFRGDTSNVAAYLMSEVLAKQSPEMREFLLRTCVVDQLDPGLVAVLTGHPHDARALRFIANGNAFVEPVPARRGCFRYQPLFREFLRSQLAFESPASVPELHRAAAEWLAEQGRLPAAIRHAVAAEAWTAATRYVVEGLCFAGLLTGDRRAVPKDLFARLPVTTAGAEAAVTRATLALVEQDTDRCALELRTARALLAEDDPARARSCSLAVSVLEAVVASLGPDLERGIDAALAAEYAIQSAPAEDELACLELRAVVAGCTGRVMVQRGDLTAARIALADGIRAAETARLDTSLRELEGMAALVEAMSGNLRVAAELAARSGLHTDDSGGAVVPLCPAAALALAWVCTDRYDLQTAWELLGHAERAAPSYDARPLGAVLALLRARLLCAHGEFAMARARLRAVRTSVDGARSTGWLDRSLVLAQAASFLAEGNPQQAVATIYSEGCDDLEAQLLRQRALRAAGSGRPDQPAPSSTAVASAPLETRIARWLVLAGEAIDEQDPARAELYLDRALRIAVPEQLRRPFFEAPADVRALLEGHGRSTRSRWLRTGVPGTAVLGCADGPGEPGRSEPDQSDLVENPLTAKEQEVLGHLADLLATEEIAKTMFVSVNTVRSHVRSILRKLGVTRRNEAVRRAWELKLLPPRGAA